MKKLSVLVLAIIFAIPLLYTGCREDNDNLPSLQKIDGIDVTIPRVVYENGKITMFVSVTDLKGNAIKGLDAGNLKIETIKDNQVNNISGFSLYSSSGLPTPIAAALTMDYSGSMYFDSTFVPAMENAVKTFINMKALTDLCEIIKFDNNVVVVQGFTADSTLLVNAVDDDSTYVFKGSTAFYNACLKGLMDADSVVANLPTTLPAVIGFTDGVNNQPPLDPDTVIARALQLQIPVYTIGFGGTATYLPDSVTLQAIADTTGGRFYWSPDPASLQQLYQYVNGQLTSAIVIGFPWGSKANATIRVTVTYLNHTATAEKMIWY
ncbi:MAG: VWA domain-containing protein [Bacteroidales bacterium]|nr:VWA domain-containing protein [Bacteroidales bacterium]